MLSNEMVGFGVDRLQLLCWQTQNGLLCSVGFLVSSKERLRGEEVWLLCQGGALYLITVPRKPVFRDGAWGLFSHAKFKYISIN